MLQSYFIEKFGKNISQSKDRIVRLLPVPWEVLRLMPKIEESSKIINEYRPVDNIYNLFSEAKTKIIKKRKTGIGSSSSSEEL